MAHPEAYRVHEGHNVDLKKWPTLARHGHGSKNDCEAKLAEHTARLSAQQELLYAADATLSC